MDGWTVESTEVFLLKYVIHMYNSIYVGILNVTLICYVLHEFELRICLLPTQFMHVSCDLQNEEKTQWCSAKWDRNFTFHLFKFYS
jgi:hypothetical protein